MTSDQLKELAQKFLDGAEWDAATVGGEQEIRLLTSLLASIRAETLEEAAKIAESMPGAKDNKELWTPVTERIASAIRDAGKKERGEHGNNEG